MKLFKYMFLGLAFLLVACGSKGTDGGAGATTFTDERDGNVYKAVDIHGQTWMAENLRYLPSVNGNKNDIDVPTYHVYDYDGSDVEEAKATDAYAETGVLYNLLAALEACPEGWHLPTEAEWNSAIDNIDPVYGGSSGRKLRAKGVWEGEYPGTDDYGFAAIPGGYLDFNKFMKIDESAYWWSATEGEDWLGKLEGHYYSVNGESTNVYDDKAKGERAYSVRCI